MIPDSTGSRETDADGLEDTVVDVDLDESLDQVDSSEAPPEELDAELGEFDPEAGRTRIGGRTTISGHLTSDVGLFVISLIAAVAGIGVLIYALINQSRTSLIFAGVISPITIIWAFLRWRCWLGGAPYTYRMLLSLNEKEAADEVITKIHEKQRKRVEKRIAELEARGVRVED